METIKYQGEEIEVEVVDEINTAHGQGHDMLYRDTGRIYYLVRDRTSAGEQQSGGRARTGFYSAHRINLTAAILWAASFGTDAELRMDTADALMESRDGYLDPWPNFYPAYKRERAKYESGDDWMARVLAGGARLRQEADSPGIKSSGFAIDDDESSDVITPAAVVAKSATHQFADGSMTVTLLLKPQPARLFRAACELTEKSPVAQIYASVRSEVLAELNSGGHDSEEEMENVFDDNAPDEVKEPHPDTEAIANLTRERDALLSECAALKESTKKHESAFYLDDTAARLLSERLKIHPDDDARDIVNAAVDFLLSDTSLEASPDSSLDALTMAKSRRLERSLNDDPQQTASTVRALASVVPKLDLDAAILLHRYLKETPWDYTMDDLVNGAVSYALTQALDARSQVNNHALSSRGRVFADDGWGYVEQDIHNARQRRCGEPEYDEDKKDGTPPARTSKDARAQSQPYHPAASFHLDHFHADLLKAFEQRNLITPAVYVKAVIDWHLEETFDFNFHGGENEKVSAENIRDYGVLGAVLTRQKIDVLCRAAGLNPDDYPEASADDGVEESSYRRGAGDPADIALLAAAAPEPISEAQAAQAKSKSKRPRKQKGGK